MPASGDQPDPLRILVASDLHAVDDVGGAVGESNIRTSEEGDAEKNPLTALWKVIQEHRVKADLLLCPGDLTERADPNGLRWAWAQLEKIANALGARVIATTGNHDIDSRLAHKKTDTYGALLDLRPWFPVDDYALANEYFARGIAVDERNDKARVVLLDTCYLHRERKRRQLTRGVLMPRALERIAEIAATPPQNPGAVNVLICHHQPLRWTEIGERKPSEVRTGDELVRLLERSPVGAWVLIHGHCHTPALDYLGRTSGGLVRLAAGSVGLALQSEAAGPSVADAERDDEVWLNESQSQIRNQFYLLEIPPPGRVPGIGLAGRFRAWDWLDGWQPAKRGSRVPGEGGFGFRASGHDLAGWLAGLGPKDFIWDDLIAFEPRLEYLAPCDTKALVTILRAEGHGVLMNENGRIDEVSLK